MYAKQKIFRVRRNYNQWVNNQTLEDYALRFTAKKSRKWSLFKVANTALGGISFLALEAIGAAITISFGFENALYAIAVVSTLIFIAGLPICFYATRYGVDIDLLTRGAGFGYIGSTATSLIYASFTFIFFAIEAAIMAMALNMMLGIPLFIGYVLCSIIVIPIVTHGITLISRFQIWTQPIWIVFQLLPFVWLLSNEWSTITEWTRYQGLDTSESGFDLLKFGAASAVLFALIAQIGEQVDYLRFLEPKTQKNRTQWWIALICAGPGWIVIGAIKLVGGSLLAYVALKAGSNHIQATDPAHIYMNIYNMILNNQNLAIFVAGIFIIVAQLKINVTNAYAGSIAWSNFFSRLTHSHPGRVVWLVFNVLIALLLMEIGVYQALEDTLGIYALVAVAWVGSLVADLLINKQFGLSPKNIEFRRAYLHDVNPVGLISMVAGSIIGIICYLGFFGIIPQALAHYITLFISFTLTPLLAWLTHGKFYIARNPVIISHFVKHSGQDPNDCCICQNVYESEDMAWCPAYSGPICSLCCSLDSRCRDSCKQTKGFHKVILAYLRHIFPQSFEPILSSKLLQFTSLISMVALILSLLLSLVYTYGVTGDDATDHLLSGTLWRVFFILLVVAGVIVWIFILAQESKMVAQEESHRQNQLLLDEISAHEKTDLELQKAKETAEAANNAKSRYLTGLSHELRTPLNSMLGYAQILENDDRLNKNVLEKISVMRRNGEHLADLIEGLLDISKIEAGKLDVHRNVVKIGTFLEQVVQTFQLQAENKGLLFNYQLKSNLPEYIITDETHLRQILINILNNAIKFTYEGSVNLTVSYKNHVAVFSVIDSGVGIPESKLEQIFKPFERIRTPGRPNVPGTGLGLTITRLLVDVLGGNVEIKNNAENGINVLISLMLPPHTLPGQETRAPSRNIYGYHGQRKTLLVVDDDDDHRRLINDYLKPLGFIILEADSAEACLQHCELEFPDLFLLDISMPGMDGIHLAKELKRRGCTAPTIMVSALASSDQNKKHASKSVVYNHSDDYIIKPIKLSRLTQIIEKYLGLEWIYKPTPPVTESKNIEGDQTRLPNKQIIQQLISYTEMGYISGVQRLVRECTQDSAIDGNFLSRINTLTSEFELNKLLDLLKHYQSTMNQL